MHAHIISAGISLALLVSQLAQVQSFPHNEPSLHPRQVVSFDSTVPSALLTCLAPLGSSVLQRDTTAFQANRYGFDLRYTYDPAVIVMANSAADVQTAVKCAAASNVPVAPRSGGHSFEGYSIGGQNGSLVIDLTGLSSVTVVGSQAKVGSGIRLGPLYLSLYNQGNWTINAGTCPSVGIGGHALGGGFGLLARKYGLLIDRIQEMEVVNANGDIITTSATQNPDMFYALRGAGGGSFGVVTSFTLSLIQPPDVVTSFTYDWNLSDYTGVLRAYVDFQANAPRELGVEMNVASNGLEMYGTYQGSKAQQAAALAPFLNAVPAPTASDVREGRLIDAQLRFAYMAGDPTDINALSLTTNKPGDSRYTKGKSLVYPTPLTNATIALIGKWASQTPVGSTANYIIIDLWGGAVQDTTQNATSFVHRDAHTVFEFVAEWNENPDAIAGIPDCQGCLQWMNDMYNDFLQDYQATYGSVRGYQNYIDNGIPNWKNAYYGSAIDRLMQIKATVDPSNVFKFPQSIPSSQDTVPITDFFTNLFAAFRH
ncbi:hypothetical protein BGZ79_005607 [Entomortierella chlamydospora]|nr:hypothetical protein BGZ79_005607 [Entomortierella chlamydospora]